MVKLAFAQINCTVGDIAGNVARIRDARAKADAELVICPELSICGYPPEDLILRPAFRKACMDAVQELAAETKSGPALLVGSPWEEAGQVYNAALLLDAGKITHIHRKVQLPNYGIFDEKRLFAAGGAPEVAQFRGTKLGILVCEDVWFFDVPRMLAMQGAEQLIVINASPFERGKLQQRQQLAADVARATKLPLAYVNLVGAQDDIVFDGGSFAVDSKGEVVTQLPQFTDFSDADAQGEVWHALALGLGDYVHKNNFPGVLLGLSGGIDSAFLAALAVDALGAEKVLGVLLPSQHTSRESMEDAQESARMLGIETMTIPISPSHDAMHDALQEFIPVSKRNHLLVDGNLQSRLRGLLLMALSNATGKMLMATSNKSEVAVGYATLYGDTCGGYAPLKDVYKTEVYALANWRNTKSRVIPERSITRAPSAELAPGQTDQDQLPPYDTLDAILRQYVEGRQSSAEIIAQGVDSETVQKVLKLVKSAEYKRRQMPPGAKISPMLFGRDWRYPLTSGFKG